MKTNSGNHLPLAIIIVLFIIQATDEGSFKTLIANTASNNAYEHFSELNLKDQNHQQQNQADSIIQTLDTLAENEKIDQLLVMAQRFSLNNPDLSILLAEHARNLAHNKDDALIESRVLVALAILNYYSGNNYQALDFLSEAQSIVEKGLSNDQENMDLSQRLQAILTNKGNVYGSLGAYEKSLQEQLDALRLAEIVYKNDPENNHNFAMLLRAMNNTAVVYWRLKKTASARDLLDQALMLGRDSGLPKNIGFTLNNIGLIQIGEGEFKKAIDTYTEALEIATATNDMHGMGGAYNNLGLIMERTGDLREAVSYYLESLKISQRLGYSDGIANTCANIGRIYSLLNQPDSALYYANLGVEKARKSGAKSYLLNNYETIYRVYEITGQPEKAFYHYKQFVALKDSIFNIEKSKQIAEMEAKFQNEKKEQDNQLLRQDVEIMNQQFIIQQRNILLLVVVSSGLFLILILLYNFYRLKNRSLKQKTKLFEQEKKFRALEKSRLEDQLFAEQEISRMQNERLKQKNRELSSQVLHTMQKIDIIQNILQEIETLKSDGQEASAQCYTKISNLVKGSISLDKDWDHFKRHFDEVNPGFFSNLQSTFPGLSSSELKLCAYYRINLDTKEISRILHITPAAVQKSRHRLRKKMNINSEIELNEFMNRF